MPAVPFERAVRAPPHVLIRELDGESVLLDLESEIYFGLNAVGTRMWIQLIRSPSIQAAYDALETEFAVAPETLRIDLETLLAQLLERGLLELTDG